MKLDFHGYEDIPGYTREALQRYVDNKILPSGFLLAVLSNDLMGAVGRADVDNSMALVSICKFIHNRMPGNSWGSEDKVYEFIEDNFYNSLEG